MDDLSAMLAQVLNDPQAMQQIQDVASSLGLGGDSPQAPPTPPPATQENNNGLNLDALSSLLQGIGGGSSPAQPPDAPPPSPDTVNALLQALGNPQNNAPAPQQDTSAPDLSSLTSLLQNAMGNHPSAPPASGSGSDLSSLSNLIGGLSGNQQKSDTGVNISALTSLLSAAQPPPSGQTGSGLPFDMGTLLKLQKAMSSIGSNQENIQLLLALKPRLKENRAKKVDDAIRIMQLIQFLPLIKDSGLFGDDSGGLGGIMGGLSSNINQMLGGILGGRGGNA